MASVSVFEDEFSSSDEIPEVDLTLSIRPYMYEPVRPIRNSDSSTEETTDSESSEDGDVSFDETEAAQRVDEWCSCSNCIAMPTLRECVCCNSVAPVEPMLEEKNIACITLHEGFFHNCLSRYVLDVSYYEFVENNGPPAQPVHELYRYLAYRRFVQWVWQILGKKKRKVLPSCVVYKIRNQFPSQRYCGFQYPDFSS